MKTTHTPTPWKVAQHHYIESTESDSVIARCDYRSEKSGENDANAEFIVRAVNSHEELLEALKAVKALASEKSTHIHALCDNAIAKAEGVKS